jgi:RNA polymerase sigma-70 factor (ECF subfamily)
LQDLSQYDEKTLLLLVAKGDELAFREIFDRYRKKVLFIARKLLGSEEETEDVLQEVFLKIWTNKEKLPEILQFNSYLNSILRNVVFNMLRKRAYGAAFIEEMLTTSGNLDTTVMSQTEFYELQKRLSVAVNQLPPQQKKVFQLGRIEGYKHEEIAEMLGISKGTVKKHMAEALRNLRAFFTGSSKIILFIVVLILH